MHEAVKRVLRPALRRAPPFIQQWWHEKRVDLHVDSAEFSRFVDNRRMGNVASTRFYRHAEQQKIPGWMTPKERQVLYALARWLPGPITEIGSWVGLSTTALARGVRDSGGKVFRTYDLMLTEDQFRPIEGGIGLFLHDDNVPHGRCSEESYRREIQPTLRAPGGSNGMLKRHLTMLGLMDQVEIHVGDFRTLPAITSGVLFCDTLHDEYEIEVNAPDLNRWLKSGSVLACHDIGGRKPLIDLLREHVKLGHGVAVDSLYVAEVV